MNHLPPSEFVCFCDDKTADLILKYVDAKANYGQIAELKSTLTEYLEWSTESHGFDENFILNFIKALFSHLPRESIQEFFNEICSDGFALINDKLNVLICSDINCFYGYCSNLNLPFLHTFKNAVTSTGLSPKEFAKNNGYSFKSFYEFYQNWFFTGSCHVEDYMLQIEGGSILVNLLDFFGIKIEKFESPISWSRNNKPDIHFEEDFKGAAAKCSQKECVDFARLFSKKPRDWFERDQWHKKFEG